MFTHTTYAVHAPALSLPEAAMLPAIESESLPRNLVLPDRRIYFPMPMPDRERPVENIRRGSMAGRAILTHIKNAPAQRPKR